jgi:hypothetical protein
MEQELFQQAVALLKAGDKKGAETLLWQLTVQEPVVAEVWYGLAVCAQTKEERLNRLEKCLEIDPTHINAQNALTRLKEKQDPPQTPVVQPTPTETRQAHAPTQQSQVKFRKRLSFHWIYVSVFLILTALVVWQFIRIDRLEKTAILTGNSISALETENRMIKSDIRTLSSDADRIRNNIQSLASGLDYVTPLAENGNRYAHSHPYSDIRLKTDIVEINDPLEKLLQLRGVYYQSIPSNTG